MLEVSTSGYYQWLSCPVSTQRLRQAQLLNQIHQVYQASRCLYGSPKVHAVLNHAGIRVCVNTVAKLMRTAGIASKVTRHYRVSKESKRSRKPDLNVLDRQFDTAEPDTKWVSDVTFIRTGEGWLHLATVMDLYSRKIIGWSMDRKNTSQLAKDALRMAIRRREARRGTLIHSDQGATYCSSDYQSMLDEHGLTRSMSRRGNCYDNAVMESFFHSLKSECVMFNRYRTRAEARRSIFDYIEVFYNRQRVHSANGYLSPDTFEKSNVSTN